MKRLFMPRNGLHKVLMVSTLMPIFAILLSACTVTSSQGVALLSAFRGQPDELAEYRWQVSLGGYQTEVIAAAFPETFLFTNDENDLIYFNGWVITSVSGLNLSSGVVIEDSGAARQLTFGKRQIELHSCAPWQTHGSGDGITYLQDCDSGVEGHYQNSIIVDGSGSIVKIAQYLLGGALIVLEKAPM